TEEGGAEGGSALEEHVPDPAREQGLERGGRVLGPQVQRLTGTVDGRQGRDVGEPHDGAKGLTEVEGAVGSAGGEGGMVGAGGAGPDEDPVAGGAQEMDLLAGGAPGGPLARAGGRGRAAVDGSGELRCDPGADLERTGPAAAGQRRRAPGDPRR